MARVIIYYKYLPGYRRMFFEQVARSLNRRGVACQVWHGDPVGQDALRQDADSIDASVPVRSCWWWPRNRYLHRPPSVPWPRQQDMVVCEHTFKAPLNFLLWFWSRLGGCKFWWWGHGRNLQNVEYKHSRQERVKAWFGRRCRGWFSYSPTTDRVIEHWVGVPRRNIVTIWNAIDTSELAAQVDSWHADRGHCKAESWQRFQVPPDKNVIVFCGSLHAGKGIERLVTLADALTDEECLVVVGTGSQQQLIAHHPRIIPLGYRTGQDKSLILARASTYVCPGMIGLNVLDAIAAGLPFAGVQLDTHSPEVDYLADGQGGRLVTLAEWPSAIVELARDSERLEQLRSEMASKRRIYTVERMSSRFAAALLVESQRP